jgi:hypothetical protein
MADSDGGRVIIYVRHRGLLVAEIACGLTVLTHTLAVNCPGSGGFLSEGVAEMTKPLATIVPRSTAFCVMPPPGDCRPAV